MYPALHEVNTVLFEENRNTTFIRMVRLVFALQCRYFVLEKKWRNYIEIEKDMASLLSKYFFPCLVRLSCCCLICLTFFFICWIDLVNKENYFLNYWKEFSNYENHIKFWKSMHCIFPYDNYKIGENSRTDLFFCQTLFKMFIKFPSSTLKPKCAF